MMAAGIAAFRQVSNDVRKGSGSSSCFYPSRPRPPEYPVVTVRRPRPWLVGHSLLRSVLSVTHFYAVTAVNAQVTQECPCESELDPGECSAEAIPVGSVLSCFYECKPRAPDSWQEVTTLMLANQSIKDIDAEIVFLDGNQNIIAQAQDNLSAEDVERQMSVGLWRGPAFLYQRLG